MVRSQRSIFRRAQNDQVVEIKIAMGRVIIGAEGNLQAGGVIPIHGLLNQAVDQTFRSGLRAWAMILMAFPST